jgi:uncharacterized protein DUF6236
VDCAVADQVLYFPYISVPSDAWFTRVLLYWDAVGSIVPAPYADGPERLTPYMQDLMAAQMIRPISPEAHNGALMEPLQDFFSWLDHDPVIRARPPLGERLAMRGETELGTVMHLHTGKLGEVVAEGLMTRGLARATDCEWFEVESLVANRYMVFLATGLGARTQMEPITDQVAALASLAPDPTVSSVKRVVDEIRPTVLEKVLPAPEAPPPVSELAEFKNEHAELLGPFRRRIESDLRNVALVHDEWARQEMLKEGEQALSEQVQEIQARMNERHWITRLGTLCAILAPAVPVVAKATGHDFGDAALEAPSFMVGLFGIRRLLRVDDDWTKEPLAYAALASERLLG